MATAAGGIRTRERKRRREVENLRERERESFVRPAMRPFGISSKRSAVSKIDMAIFLFNGFLLLGFIVASVPNVLVLGSPDAMQIMDQDPLVKKCRYHRDFSLLEARCSNLGWQEIALNLRTDIEVLDASGNRVRELTNNDLTPYKSLAFIYLRDNFIQNIEEAAFANQLYLQVLDLTQNGLDNLPTGLFQLPYLRTLYLSRNKLTDSIFNVEVTSPLKILHLDKNKFTRIPNLGVQPNINYLNMSNNIITSISAEDLAPFCSLETLDLSKNVIKFNTGGCECQMFNAWVKLREIKIKPKFYNCINSTEDCANAQFSNRTYELYNECKSVIQEKVETEKARSTWILVVSCVSAFLLVIFVVLFCVHKRNRRRRREQQKEQQQLTANNANTELLNSNLKADNS